MEVFCYLSRFLDSYYLKGGGFFILRKFRFFGMSLLSYIHKIFLKERKQ